MPALPALMAGTHGRSDAAMRLDAAAADGFGPTPDGSVRDASGEAAEDAAVADACANGAILLGCPCTTAGQPACNGPSQKLQLVCGAGPGASQLNWQILGTCTSGQNCNQAVGFCEPIIPACMGQSPGFAFCAAGAIDVVSTCGPDLVSATTQRCAGVCAGGVCQSPRCGDGKVETSEECDDGNTTPLDGCEPSVCLRSGVLKIAAGVSNTCALCRGGYVRCWGENTDGELGLGHTLFEGDRHPYQITDAAGNPGVVNLDGQAATDVGVGDGFACALLAGGTVRCWGKNDYGQLGLDNTIAMPTEVGPTINLGTGLTAASLSVGAAFACAVLSDGSVRCWGDNLDGQLGLGNADPVLSGTASLGVGVTVSAVAAGFDNVCVIETGGGVHCWGDNTFGEFGLGSQTIIDSTTQAPSTYGDVVLAAGRTVTALVAGNVFDCVRFDDGGAECWGYNLLGELGIGSTQGIGDDEVPGTAGMVAIGSASVAGLVAGDSHTCALLADGGGMKCWGDNSSGELGQGDTLRRGNTAATEPAQIPAILFPTGLTPIAATAGSVHTCALLSDGSVKCWGWNEVGQLGLGVVSGTQPGTLDYIGGAPTETPDRLPSVQIIAPH